MKNTNNKGGLTLDDRHEIFNPYKSPCYNCENYNADDYSCPAFPYGVLDSILSGNNQHTVVINGQIGNLVSTPIES